MVPLNVLLLENPEVQPPTEHERPIVKFRQQLQQDPRTYPKHDGARQHTNAKRENLGFWPKFPDVLVKKGRIGSNFDGL